MPLKNLHTCSLAVSNIAFQIKMHVISEWLIKNVDFSALEQQQTSITFNSKARFYLCTLFSSYFQTCVPNDIITYLNKIHCWLSKANLFFSNGICGSKNQVAMWANQTQIIFTRFKPSFIRIFKNVIAQEICQVRTDDDDDARGISVRQS